MALDIDTPLTNPIRLGDRYPTRMLPFTTVGQLVDFAQNERLKWQRVEEDLLKALDSEAETDFILAIARFKSTADERRWLGK